LGAGGLHPARQGNAVPIPEFGRIVFRFEDGDAIGVDYLDYH
jgi:hypothetical protein